MHQLDFNWVLRSKRRDLKIHQQDMRRILGIGMARLHALEHGRAPWPREVFEQYCQTVGATPPPDLEDCGIRFKAEKVEAMAIRSFSLREEHRQRLKALADRFSTSEAEVVRQLIDAAHAEAVASGDLSAPPTK